MTQPPLGPLLPTQPLPPTVTGKPRPFAPPLRRRALSLLAVPAVALAALSGAPSGAAAQADLGEPRIVEMDEQPILRNGDDMARLLDRRYPPLLKDAGIEGAAEVWIHIDDMGRVRETRLRETSGYVAFDEAAESVAALMSFEAARKGDRPIAVWVPMTINFRQSAAADKADEAEKAEIAAPEGDLGVGEPPMARAPSPAAEEAAPERMEPPARADTKLSDQPRFTPMTVAPALQNNREVSAALREHYPPMLRDAGIGGSTSVWFFIDEEGVVEKTRVNESSGFDALDQAALEVAGLMRFSPAYNRDEKVPVWVALAITFEVQ